MLPFTRPCIGAEELSAVREVLKSGWITTGPRSVDFENALADYLGGGVQVRVFNSGTSALEASLLAHDIGLGDEVIVPAMSFVATANVVVRCGAKPVFVDVDLVSRNINGERIAPAITSKTKAIIPVHFAGYAVEMDEIYRLAEQHQLLVIEDAAQAIGTQYQGCYIGSSGNPVCFSFHPNKNITTIEGGAVASNDSALIQRLERLRFHGIERDAQGGIDVGAWGGKMNMPDVNAAVGLAQLPKLEGFNRKRWVLVQRYVKQLPEHEALLLPENTEGHSWHMFCVLFDWEKLGLKRSQAQDIFKQHAINAGMHYPAMPNFSFYRKFGNKRGDFPNAERIGEQTVTLPLFPAMDEQHIDQVCAAVEAVLSS
jgi:dTDP-4-amino-4,6-dideoxygalactose transaminase